MPDRPSVFIVILCSNERHGWIHPLLALAMTQWTQDERLDMEFRVPAEEAVGAQVGFNSSQEARNWAVREFLKTNHTHLLMIDNDTVPVIGSRIVNLPEMALLCEPGTQGVPLDIVAAPVPVLQSGKLYLNCYVRQPSGLYRGTYGEEFQAAKETGDLLERDAVGTGAICIRRAVVERLLVETGEPIQDDAAKCYRYAHAAVFLRPRHPDGATITGEDLLFCERARAAGFRCWSSILHLCGHAHTMNLLAVPETEIANRPAYSFTDWTAEDYGLPPETKLPELTTFSSQPGTCALLRRLFAEIQPDVVVEFGAGISTLVLADCALNNLTTVLSYESDLATQELTRRLAPRATVIYAPLSDAWAPGGVWYSPPSVWYSPPSAVVKPYPHLRILVFVDGPSTVQAGPRGRGPAMAWIDQQFPSWSGAIVLDDVNREGEAQDFIAWVRRHPDAEVAWEAPEPLLPKRVGVLRRRST